MPVGQGQSIPTGVTVPARGCIGNHHGRQSTVPVRYKPAGTGRWQARQPWVRPSYAAQRHLAQGLMLDSVLCAFVWLSSCRVASRIDRVTIGRTPIKVHQHAAHDSYNPSHHLNAKPTDIQSCPFTPALSSSLPLSCCAFTCRHSRL